MASNRDALAEIIAGSPGVGEFDGLLVAGRIARAGWRPPARVITEVSELDALPPGTLVFRRFTQDLGRGRVVHTTAVYQRWEDDDESGWMEPGAHTVYESTDIQLPVTVLHEPEEGQ